MTLETIAKVVHESIKTWSEANGQSNGLKHWEEAEDWQKESSVKQVQYRLNHPEDSEAGRHAHESWLSERKEQGWKWGAFRNNETKENPAMVDYDQLSVIEKKKDLLLCAIVDALK